ncbi:MAG: hypothetical protein HQ495_12100 [Alphaproteobacteria bacterium]|nr:hypothetical protein [Alphaproteobacteria bacterium]
MPRAFFDNHVRPNYRAWLADPGQEYLAKNAVTEANNMAARVFHHWEGVDPTRIRGAKNEGEYRNLLAAHECPDFALVRDVADAHKHVTLDRASRQVTNASQTHVDSLGWGEATWGEAKWGSPPELVISLDDGSKRPLDAIMENVIEMWDRLLEHWGI